jgi:hypothetical protein
MIASTRLRVAAESGAEKRATEIRARWSLDEHLRRAERAESRTRRLYALLFPVFTSPANEITALGAATAEDMQRLVG